MVRHGGIVALISNKKPLLDPLNLNSILSKNFFDFLSFFLFLELKKKHVKCYFDDSCALEVR